MFRHLEFFFGAWAGCAAVLVKIVPLAAPHSANLSIYGFTYAASFAMTWFFLFPRGKWSVIASLGTLAVFGTALAVTASGGLGLVFAVIGGVLAYLGIAVAIALRHASRTESIVVGIIAGALTALPALAYIGVAVNAS